MNRRLPAEEPVQPVARDERRARILSGSLFAAMWRLAMPMMLAALLEDAYNLTDMYFVGRLGKGAISAVGMGGSVLAVFRIFMIGVTSGAAALISQAVGAGRRDRAEAVTGQALLSAGALWVAFVAVAIPLAERSLAGLGARGGVLADGTAYLRIMAVGSIAMMLGMTLGSALRGAGDAVTPMKLMAVGVVINIALDPLFIFGGLGIPAMGVAGSALASAASRIVPALLIARVFFRGRHDQFHLHKRHFRPHGRTIAHMFRIGVFGSAQGGLRSVSNLLLIAIAAGFGAAATDAYVVGMRLRMVVMMIGMGFGAAAMTLVGQNIGAGLPGRAERAGWTVTGTYAAIAAVLSVLFWGLAEPLARLFTDAPDVVDLTSSYLRWFAACFVMMTLTMVLGQAMIGAGDTLRPMLVTAFGMLVLRIPLAYLLAWAWGSVIGVWAALTISIVVEGALAAALFRWGPWKRVGAQHLALAAAYE